MKTGLLDWARISALLVVALAGGLSGCGRDRGGGDDDDDAADGDADADGDTDADTDADGDGDGDTDADTDADGDCCVVVEGIGEGTVELCAGPPIYGGPATAGPSIDAYGYGIELRAGLDQDDDQANALLVQAFEAEGAGDTANPMVEYWSSSGTWFENNAMDGAMRIDSWPAVGERVTGTFSGTAYNMGGDGPESYALSGTFCATRVADRE